MRVESYHQGGIIPNCDIGSLHPAPNWNIKQYEALRSNNWESKSNGESYCIACCTIGLSVLQNAKVEREREKQERDYSRACLALKKRISAYRLALTDAGHVYNVANTVKQFAREMRELGFPVVNQWVVHNNVGFNI